MAARERVLLDAGPASCTVAPALGGRIASLTVHGNELLVTATPAQLAGEDPHGWGCFPMAPWAGRVRDGRFTFAGRQHRLPRNLAPHAIHGTVVGRAWDVARTSETAVELEVGLGPAWPFAGRVTQRIELSADRLRCTLAVHATDDEMPAELGWHPWFAKPTRAELRFAAMYQLDHSGIPTGALTEEIPAGPWDDCFVGPIRPPQLDVAGVRVTISSDCDDWVVYDRPAHATCVEPQSGPPDAINSDPRPLAPGESLERWMEISWERLPVEHPAPA